MTELVANHPKLKLYYFDIPGKGEAIRLACAYGKLPLEDVRITGEQFQQLKAEGKLSFGQVPALSVNDSEVLISQSAAIMRFVGKFAGLYPTNDDFQAALIDSLVDQESDMFTGLSVTRYRERMGFAALNDETVFKIRKTLNDEVLPKHLGFFEAFLRKSPSGWLAGGPEPSIADFILVPRLQWLATPNLHDGIESEVILNNFPLLKALIEKFLNLPCVVEYYSQRK